MFEPTYFNYWGKAKTLLEIDYCLARGSDQEIAERHGLTLQKLLEKVTRNSWCRVGENTDFATHHLLPYHCLDVAAVASVWWDRSPTLQDRFHRHAEKLSKDQTKALVLFFITLHDYGKFDARFQLKASRVWKKLNADLCETALVLPGEKNCKTYDHGSAGLYWYNQDHPAGAATEGDFTWDSIFEESVEVEENKFEWIKAVCGHHGFVFSKDNMPFGPDYAFPSPASGSLAERDKKARIAWIDTMEEIFLAPVGLSASEDIPPPSPLLAGFCSVSDWLGSRSDDVNFHYQEEATPYLGAYFAEKCEADAQRVFALSGIGGRSKPYIGVKALLKEGYSPRQLQTQVENLPSTPGLTIVEAPTGSGKTEMALAYAWRLLENRQADSIIFALPTQASSNAMFNRLESLAAVLFDEHPNLLLAHGNARFNKNFIELKKTPKTAQGEEAWAQCSEWLAQSRKRIFLGQIGICTIDQVLVSVLPVKHRFIRGFGIGRSVLIVDEVHAYDAYMYGLLEEVLRQQHRAGGASILLSATLPATLKQNLLATYGGEVEEDNLVNEQPYPLVSCCDGKKTVPFKLTEDQSPASRNVDYELYEDADMLPDERLCRRILSAAEQGAQIAVICNLVDVAQNLTRKLQEQRDEKQLDIDIGIFHARYCLQHRQSKEEAVLNRFGPDPKPTDSRRKGRILVATQVIEQSLDLDFDWLITQLCPIDLLFQRMGRLHRHEKHDAARPDAFKKPLCSILQPPGTDYGVHGLIYSNTRVMWRTAAKLRDFQEKTIAFPEAYRGWINPIYQEEAWGDEPAEVEAGFEKHQDKLLEKRSYARQMLKWAEDAAINDSDDKVRAVTRDDEFNLSLVPYLNTANGKRLLNGDIFDKLDEWQQAEALAMSAVGVPQSWGGKGNRLQPEADKQGYIWLEMDEDGEYWRTEINNMELSYHPEWGMEKSA